MLSRWGGALGATAQSLVHLCLQLLEHVLCEFGLLLHLFLYLVYLLLHQGCCFRVHWQERFLSRLRARSASAAKTGRAGNVLLQPRGV